MKKIYYILIAFAIATPIGLYLTNAPAWGEWDNSYYKEKLGFVPKAIESANSKALIPDYSLPGLSDVGSYYLSAIVGIALIFAIFFILKKFIKNA